jgi:hypothetical protein
VIDIHSIHERTKQHHFHDAFYRNKLDEECAENIREGDTTPHRPSTFFPKLRRHDIRIRASGPRCILCATGTCVSTSDMLVMRLVESHFIHARRRLGVLGPVCRHAFSNVATKAKRVRSFAMEPRGGWRCWHGDGRMSGGFTCACVLRGRAFPLSGGCASKRTAVQVADERIPSCPSDLSDTCDHSRGHFTLWKGGI